MDIADPPFPAAVREAFTCYLAFLSHTQATREARLPKQGKGVETTDDISSQEHFQTRVAVTELCLQYTERIASSVQIWADDPPEDSNEEGITLEGIEDENSEWDFEGFVPDGQPFLDIFSGKWLEPITPFSAGPSGIQCNDDSGEDCKEHKSSTEPLGAAPPVIERTVEDPPPVNDLPLELSPTRHLGDGIHRPLSDSSPNASSDVSSSKSLSSHYHSATATPSCDSEQDNASTTSEVFRNSCTQSQLDFEFATRMYDEEKKRVEEEDHNLARAQQLAEEWAEEERRKRSNEEKLETQKAFADAQRLADARARQDQIKRENEERSARDAARLERENIEKRRREEEAAARVRRLAQKTEALAEEAAAAAMSGEEKWRRYVPHNPRVAAVNFKTEKKAKLKRERQYAQEVDQRNRVRRESAQKRYEENSSPIIPLQRVPRPYQQTYSSQQRASPARSQQRSAPVSQQRATPTRSHRPAPVKIECVSCMEPGDKAKMAVLPCKHAYCGDCLSGAFKAALSSRSPFKCCKINVPITHGSPFLSSTMTRAYKLLLTELGTRNPIYCASPSCHTFIPNSQIHGLVATCSSRGCKTRTCVLCKKKVHKGVCAEDKDGKAVKEMAREKGWKMCPKCSQVVERTEGCLHMTCRCNAQWCYNCLRDWNVCNSTCGRY